MADFPILKWMQVDGRSVPFTYPQHQKGNGYVITGEDNPLPTGNHVMTESGIWIPQRGSDEGAVHTQLTGSNVEHYIFDSLAIADTSAHTGNPIDLSRYSKITVLGRSTLNVPVYLGLRVFTTSGTYWDGEKWVGGFPLLGFDQSEYPELTGDSSKGWQILNSYWTFLNDYQQKGNFSLYARCKNAPTSGELTVLLIGRE